MGSLLFFQHDKVIFKCLLNGENSIQKSPICFLPIFLSSFSFSSLVKSTQRRCLPRSCQMTLPLKKQLRLQQPLTHTDVTGPTASNIYPSPSNAMRLFCYVLENSKKESRSRNLSATKATKGRNMMLWSEPINSLPQMGLWANPGGIKLHGDHFSILCARF